VSYLLHPYSPKVRFNRRQFAELFRFGRWVLGTTIVSYVVVHGDDLFLGKVLGAAALGLYQVVYRISTMTTTELAYVTGTVMMPAYAKAQDEQARLARGFLAVLETVSGLALPFMVFLVVASRDIVAGLLPPHWADAVVPLQILAVAGFLRALTATGDPLFVGTGRPHMQFWMNLASLCVLALSIYPLTRALGVEGTCLAATLGFAASLPVWARAVTIAGVPWAEVLRSFGVAAILGLLVLGGVLCGRLIPVDDVRVRLVGEVLAAAVLCGAGACVASRWLGRGPVAQFARAWSSLCR